MWKELDHQARAIGSPQRSPSAPPAAEPGRRSREQVMLEIKLELATEGALMHDARARGFDPYNSRLGTSGRDPWGSRRRA